LDGEWKVGKPFHLTGREAKLVVPALQLQVFANDADADSDD
jgi:hypothetical protein